MGVESRVETATIANGESLSGAIGLGLERVYAIQMPSAWTAGNLTFQASYDNSTFADVYQDDGTELTVTAAASRFIVLDPVQFLGIRAIKVRSGTSGSPVNQGAARSLQLVTTG